MKLQQHARENRKGFSLAELMVVIVIIALLAAFVGRNVLDRLFTSQRGIAKAEIMTIVEALNDYAINNNGTFPDSLESLVTPDPTGRTYLDGDIIPVDPWKNEYGYEPPQSGSNKPKVFTYGKDGVPGGEGDDMDFDSDMIRNKEV